MTFNTTSFIAGVGSVVVVLSTGFAAGYFIANPTKIDPPNRLQRLAAEDHATAPAKPEVVAKPETVAAATPVPAATPAPAASAAPVVTPANAATTAQPPAQQPVIQQAAAQSQPTAPPTEVKAPEPARVAVAPEASAPANADKVDADKITAEKASADNRARAAEAKQAERKQRSDARRYAEQQRKQRELEIATVAVKRIIHGRDAGRDGPDVIRVEHDRGDRDEPVIVENDPQEAPAPEMPHFNLFGQ